jgi:hypothetical protein
VYLNSLDVTTGRYSRRLGAVVVTEQFVFIELYQSGSRWSNSVWYFNQSIVKHERFRKGNKFNLMK